MLLLKQSFPLNALCSYTFGYDSGYDSGVAFIGNFRVFDLGVSMAVDFSHGKFSSYGLLFHLIPAPSTCGSGLCLRFVFASYRKSEAAALARSRRACFGHECFWFSLISGDVYPQQGRAQLPDVGVTNWKLSPLMEKQRNVWMTPGRSLGHCSMYLACTRYFRTWHEQNCGVRYIIHIGTIPQPKLKANLDRAISNHVPGARGHILPMVT